MINAVMFENYCHQLLYHESYVCSLVNTLHWPCEPSTPQRSRIPVSTGRYGPLKMAWPMTAHVPNAISAKQIPSG